MSYFCLKNLFHVSFKVGLFVINSPAFVCLEKSISPLYLRIALLDGYHWLALFFFEHFEYMLSFSSGVKGYC